MVCLPSRWAALTGDGRSGTLWNLLSLKNEKRALSDDRTTMVSHKAHALVWLLPPCTEEEDR